MKLLSASLLILLTMLLGGCASTIRSDVSVIHDWPSGLVDKSFVIEVPASHQANAEYAGWQDILRGELVRHGFSGAASGAVAGLKVFMSSGSEPIEVKMVRPIYLDPFWAARVRHDPFWYNRRWYPRTWGHRYYFDPFWYNPPVVYQELIDLRYQHQLQITITQTTDGKKLYEGRVTNESHRDVPLAVVMPFMIKSAFAQFPGKSGSSHHVDYEMPR